MPQTKHLLAPVEFKDGEDGTGEVVARFSVFDIVDRDGDILRRSAFTDGQAVPMVWSHQWDQPIGKGRIVVKNDHAEFHGQFLSTPAAQAARTTVREMADLQEWSFGFRITETQDNPQIRGLDITGSQVFEVSPVLVGANQETATLAVKGGPPAEEDEWTLVEIYDDDGTKVFDAADLVPIADEAKALAKASTTEDLADGLRRLAALVEDVLKALPLSADELIEQERLALEAMEIEEAA